MLHKVSHIFTLILILIFAQSCYPVFTHPIQPLDDSKVDMRLLGAWSRTNKSHEKEQLLIFPRKSGWMDTVYVYDINSTSSMDGINILVFEGYKAVVNEESFLCLRTREKDCFNKQGNIINSSFLIVVYEIKNEKELVIKPFSIEKVGQLINEGVLKGEITQKDISKGSLVNEVIVSSSSTELTEIILEKGSGVFLSEDANDILTFVRISN